MAASFFISLLVIYFRRPDSFYNPQFWAEEGTRFFADAYHSGFKSLFNTCNGYFHLFPRLLACTLKLIRIPYELFPSIFCYSWLFILFLILLYIWKRLPFNSTQKFFIALTVTFIPIQSEIIMNLTNIQWILVLFPIIIFSSSDETTNKKWFWIDAMVLILAGLTGPNFTVMLPLFFMLMYKSRKEFSFKNKQSILLILSIICGIVVAISLFNYGSVDRTEGQFTIFNSGFIKYFYVQYAFLFLGLYAEQSSLPIMIIVTLILIAIMLFVLLKLLGNKQNTFGRISFMCSILFFMVTAVAYRYVPQALSPYYCYVRNFYLPALTFVWAIITVLPQRKWATIALTLLMFLFITETICFAGRTYFKDFNWKENAKQITTSDTLSIPINPSGWFIHIDNRK